MPIQPLIFPEVCQFVAKKRLVGFLIESASYNIEINKKIS